jgi:hypothetical protein
MKTSTPPDGRRLCQAGQDSDSVKIDKEFEALIPPLYTRADRFTTVLRV